MRQRTTILILHALLAGLALMAAFILRFDFGSIPDHYIRMMWMTLPISILIKVVIAEFFGLNHGLWRYASLSDVFRIVQTAVISTLIFIPIVLLMMGHGYPRGVLALDFILTVALFAAPRLMGRHWVRESPHGLFRKAEGVPTLILGAGDAGELAMRQLQQEKGKSHRVIGFLDDDPAKQGLAIHGAPILGTSSEAESVLKQWNVDVLVIAIRDPGKVLLERMNKVCTDAGVEIRILPTLQDLLTGEIQVKPVRALRLEDLLGREPVQLDPTPVQAALKGKRILVTGAGGSIGSELCRQIAGMEPANLCLLDHAENALFNIEQELRETRPSLSLSVSMCDIRDPAGVNTVFQTFKPEVVFHAAACKHVPLMEDHPSEAIHTNVLGTLHVLDASKAVDVGRFLLVSTDKAACPANIMGATKWLAEQLVREAGLATGNQYSCVRFGNVLGSQGSVVPTFERQIAQGGPVRVTHEEATRYFMTIPEAVQLILQADALSSPGDVFILDMGEPVQILSLARNMIKLSGFKPDQNMEIRIVGLRPGEKLHEQLTSPREEVVETDVPKLNRLDLKDAVPSPPTTEDVTGLKNALSSETADQLADRLWKLVPTS